MMTTINKEAPMSLGFVLGTAAKDHRKVLLDQLAADMVQFPNDQFFI
jgi:hypothetical protein